MPSFGESRLIASIQQGNYTMSEIMHNQKSQYSYPELSLANKLLEKSLNSRPEMPINYHIETLRIASRLIGGKR